MIRENLFAPVAYGTQPCCYWKATPAMIDEHTGGCGPGGWGDLLVPDRMYGLNVNPCCRIHDWMYSFGATLADKELSDRAFLNNMVRFIRGNTKWRWVARLRMRRARTYYHAVKTLGGPAFWDDKNKPGEMSGDEVNL